MKRLALLCLIVLAAGCAYSTLPLTEPVPRPAPLVSIPEPGERKVGAWYAFCEAEFLYPAQGLFDLPRHVRWALGVPERAKDIDPFGEVIDSNWFTNRNTRQPLSPEEMERGAAAPPAPGVWTVTRGKRGGIQPGFEMTDAAGRKFIIKLDVLAYPEMATSAEAIAERFYYAAGYNVPGASVVHFRLEDLRIAPGAKYFTPDGFSEPLTPEALKALLAPTPRRQDGTYRAAAVTYIGGKLKGSFSFLGVRADDPNDTVPHQHRRELRSLIVLSSLVNNPDLIETNTLDSYVTEGGLSYLKHYLIDFGTSLGSYAFIYKPRRTGHEHAIDWGGIGKRLFSLGLYEPRFEREPLPVAPFVGYLDNALFDPAHWRGEYPNPAFDYLTAEDGFWGARVVASFSEPQIRAAVRSGRLSDPLAEEYMVRSLVERRQAICRYWFAQVSPLAGFALSGPPEAPLLSFRDLGVEAGVAQGAGYEARVAGRGEWRRMSAGPLPLAELGRFPEGGPFELELRALRPEGPLPPVRLGVRRGAAGLELAGAAYEGR